MPLIVSSSRFAAAPAGDPLYYRVLRSIAPDFLWKLNEIAGTTAADEIQSVDLTHVNTPSLGQTSLISTVTTTSVTYASASSEYSEVQAASITSYPHTLECWLNTGTTQAQTAVYVGDKDDANTQSILAFDSSAHALATTIDASTASSATGTTVLSDSTTHHVAAVFTSAADRSIYVDGVLEDNNTTSRTDVASSYDTTSIARSGDSTPSSYWDGTLQYVAAHSKALTRTEIKRKYLIGTGSLDEYLTLTLATSPISYWRLGESSGAVAFDEVGSDDGAATGGFTVGQTGALIGDSDTCYHYNGADAVTVTTSISDIPPNEPNQSAVLWVKTSDTTATVTPFALRLTATADNGNEGILVIWNIAGATGRITARHNGQNLNSTSDVYTDGAWHNVVATLEGTTFSLYIDGVLNNSSTVTRSTISTPSLVYIGNNTTAVNQHIEANIDEVAVYDVALSAGEVADLYAMGTYGPDVYQYVAYRMVPAAYWRLNESSGTSAADETGRYTGTHDSATGVGNVDVEVVDSTYSVDYGSGLTTTTNLGTQLATDITGATELSVSGWMKFDTIPTSATEGRVMIRSDAQYRMYFYVDTPTTEEGFYFFINGVTASLAASPQIPTGSLSTGTWFHIVGTYSSVSGEAKIYLDGTLVETKTGLSGVIATSSNATRLASDSAGTGLLHDGHLQEIAVYDKELTYGEVVALYDKGKGNF